MSRLIEPRPLSLLYYFSVHICDEGSYFRRKVYFLLFRAAFNFHHLFICNNGVSGSGVESGESCATQKRELTLLK